MRSNSVLGMFFLLTAVCCLATSAAYSRRIVITTSPELCRIYVNGVLKGVTKVEINISKDECVTVEIRQQGYIQETRVYCNKKHMPKPSSAEYIQLKEDEAYVATEPSVANSDNRVNNDIAIETKSGKAREDAWRQIVSTVLSRFDQLESNDEKTGYLRTGWAGFSFKTNTIRIRLIVRQNPDNPAVYKVKIVSEESGKPGTPYNADEQYKTFDRLPRKYLGLIEELTARVRN